MAKRRRTRTDEIESMTADIDGENDSDDLLDVEDDDTDAETEKQMRTLFENAENESDGFDLADDDDAKMAIVCVRESQTELFEIARSYFVKNGGGKVRRANAQFANPKDLDRADGICVEMGRNEELRAAYEAANIPTFGVSKDGVVQITETKR